METIGRKEIIKAFYSQDSVARKKMKSAYVNKWVEKGEVVKYSKFEKKVKDNKRRLVSRDREAVLIEKLTENSGAASKRTWSNFLSDLESKYGKPAVRKRK